MTGDGAVVREWRIGMTTTSPMEEAIYATGRVSPLAINKAVDEHNAAIRQQAAEIERLTGDLKSALSREKTMTETAMVIVARAIASEAQTAALLKALERYGHHMVDCKSQRAASRTSASCGPCTCGLAAAKGGTV